ncbi:hypothetical protein ATN79_25045 [Paraburkholderia caribensis]|nr:hypothetical protein ATN79_25045 [Paraburkholderia caribensis]
MGHQHQQGNAMEFLLLATIFLTSTAFLVNAGVSQAPSAVTAPASASVSVSGASEGGAMLQPAPEFPGMNGFLLAQPDRATVASTSPN